MDYQWNDSWKQRFGELTENCTTKEGVLTRFILNTRTEKAKDTVTRVTYGQRDESKPHKTILLVGETGMGKSTVINAMVNHMLGVQSNDRSWFELIETKGNQTESQTETIAVYDVSVPEFPVSFTIIDTPGFGNTKGTEEDLKTAELFFDLCRSNDGVSSVDAVCLVLSSHTTRLGQKQLYVFDAVLSMFGKDVEENTVVFITHAPRKPCNALRAIVECNLPCVKAKNKEPLYFRFDNFHCENFNDKELLEDYQAACSLLRTTMGQFLEYLKHTKAASLQISEQVLQTRQQLARAVARLEQRTQLGEPNKLKLEQARAAVRQFEEKNDGVYYEEDEWYKEKVPIKSLPRPLSKTAISCTVCQETCHYQRSFWGGNHSLCDIMHKGKCTVCPGRCAPMTHVKEDKIYVTKKRKVKKVNEDFKTKYETRLGEIKGTVSRIEQEIQREETEKVRLLEECYQCVLRLHWTALKKDSNSMIEHLEFLIPKVAERGDEERVQQLNAMVENANKYKNDKRM